MVYADEAVQALLKGDLVNVIVNQNNTTGYSIYDIPEEVAILHHYKNSVRDSNFSFPDHKMLDYAPELMNALGKYLCVP